MNRTTPIYIPTSQDRAAAERWDIVRGALEDNGYTDIRPAPLPSLSFIPRQLRQEGSRHG